MAPTGRVARRHRRMQIALASGLVAAGVACLAMAVQVATPSRPAAVGEHLARAPSAAAAVPGAGATNPARHSSPPAPRPTPAVATSPNTPAHTSDVATPRPNPGAPAPDVSARAPLPVAIEIPGIDVRTELVTLGLDSRRRLEVPTDPDRAGWYAGGPRPGEGGAAIIVGHVDWTDGPAVFWRLPDLRPDDAVSVRGRDGTMTRFLVDRVERWPKDEFPTDLVYDGAHGSELRLITCGGTFDEHAHRYRDNIIVFARLA